MPPLIYSEAGIEMTEGFEGLVLSAYQDVAGVWTIGYGHTGPDVTPDLVITQAEAEALLEADVAQATTFVNRVVIVTINQNQFDALVDFAFNLGCGALLHSTLLTLVNQSDFTDAVGQFGRWVHAGGVIQPGLVRRRAAEAALFADAPATA